ncbi:MAG TPA: DciA family protein [Burkholderiales bacterium]
MARHQRDRLRSRQPVGDQDNLQAASQHIAATVRPEKLNRILSAQSELQPLLAKAHDLRVLSGLVHRFLPAELGGEARVVNFRDSQLTLAAPNSAAAAKLKLLAPALARFLTERRWQVNSVSVRVQPTRSRAAAPAPRDVQFSTSALQALRALHDAMRPSPAREALARLLQRRAARRPRG